MSYTQFKKCHAVTSKWEGGWSDHAADPGGKTMYGITEGVWRAWQRTNGQKLTPVRHITRAQAEEVYRHNYWQKSGAENLNPGVDLAVYDASVNSGVSRGRKWLLASIGGPDHETVKRICDRRLGFVQSLRIWKTFGKGWGRRIADIKAKGIAWALAAQHDKIDVVEQLKDEAAASKKTASTQTKAAGGTAAGTSASGVGIESQLDPASADQMASWVLGGFVVLGVAVAGFLIIRAVLNAQQAEAFKKEALEISP